MQALAPSPTSLMSSSMNNPPDVFPGDFIAGIASSLDDFDPTMFRGDPGGDINFERDFGQWFSPDVNDIVNPLDMK
jgi:collagen type III alpha